MNGNDCEMLPPLTTDTVFLHNRGLIQRNALKNRTLLQPDAAVILSGDDRGSRSWIFRPYRRYEMVPSFRLFRMHVYPSDSALGRLGDSLRMANYKAVLLASLEAL